MSQSAPVNPFAPPQAVVSDAIGMDGIQLATRGQRFAAALVDGAFGLALSVAIMLPMYGTGYFRLMAADKTQVLAGLLLYLALFYVVEGWFLYQRSQTLGKMALGLRIVRPDGSHAGFARAFGVRLLLLGAIARIPFVGPFIALVDVLFIFRAQRRCLHDLAADTIVVTAASSPLPAAA